MTEKEYFMSLAVEEAKQAASKGDIPIGAVLVKDGKVIAAAHNLRENGGGATAHAEILAINEASRKLGGWRLSGCTLYVTLEPCPMCAGACVNARLGHVVYGASDERGGALGSLLDLTLYPLNHRPAVTRGVKEEECKNILCEYFKKKR